MKQIEAIIKPFRLEDVKEALIQAGVGGLTIGEVRGIGRERAHTETYRGIAYKAGFRPRVKLQIVVKDEMTAKVVGLLLETARTGKIGDGKIIVRSVEEAIRIRTAERGVGAL